MKVCVIQPQYSFEERDAEVCFEKLLGCMDQCDESLDLIILPEYSDALADVKGMNGFYHMVNTYNQRLLKKAAALAKRCHSLVFVNAGYQSETGIRNTTYAFDREGNIAGRYYKAHPAPSEVKTEEQGGHELDVGYSYELSSPYVIELEGLRFGFLTCYDFYFYENYAQIAREKVDVIIGCSLQRTDSHEVLSIINRFLCYHTNAYLVRASVSLSEDSLVCGCSMVVSPEGKEILNLKNRVGLGICEIDPKKKFYKVAGHLGALKPHYEYIEEGRRPWLYRNGGASIVLFDEKMPYPRLCAYHGFNTVAPKGSMAAFGSAVALDAEEIAFDLWSTKDGILVSCCDDDLEYISNGVGKVYEYTYDELLALDFGVNNGDRFRETKIPSFEEILRKFAGRVIMNIHVKIWDNHFENPMTEEIIRLIRRYDCEKHVYLVTTNDAMICSVMKNAPDIRFCVGWNGDEDPMSIVDRAIELGACKVQFYKSYFDRNSIDKAHAHGIICNICDTDDPEEAKWYLDMGIDTILTNDYFRLSNAVRAEMFLHHRAVVSIKSPAHDI